MASDEGRNSHAISAEQVEVTYGVHRVFSDVSLRTNEGEWTVIVGGNGAGKSTLLRAVAGLLPLRAGVVRIRGVDVTGWSVVRRRKEALLCPYLAQGGSVFEGLSVRENLLLAARGMPPRLRDARVQRLLTIAPAIERRLDREAVQLSGGERQFLAIGMMLLACEAPPALLLDEPCAGIAPDRVGPLLDWLREFSNETKSAIVFAEHDLKLFSPFADRTLCLADGTVTVLNDDTPASAPLSVASDGEGLNI